MQILTNGQGSCQYNSQNFGAPFCTSILTFKFLIPYPIIQTRENQGLLLMHTLYANASNNTHSYTHINLHVV